MSTTRSPGSRPMTVEEVVAWVDTRREGEAERMHAETLAPAERGAGVTHSLHWTLDKTIETRFRDGCELHSAPPGIVVSVASLFDHSAPLPAP